jgi:integrase
MASINKYIAGGREYHKLVDTSSGHRIQYAVKLDKFTETQWIKAHSDVISSLSPEDRQTLANAKQKEIVLAWLQTPKEGRASAKQTGIKIQGIEAKGEAGIKKVVESYLRDFCQPEANSQNAIGKARWQCRNIMLFFEQNKVSNYSQLKRDLIKKYPEWRFRMRGKTAADTVNQELRRLGSVIRHGVKYCGWHERYLLEGVKVKPTPQNTKAIKPFEISEAKAILAWLMANADISGNWYLHDMALLAICAGLEAKALTLLRPEWFKLDLGILRVYDKLVSGVIDAKTQNRARDVPLTPTLRKIFERGYVFKRPANKKGRAAAGLTRIHNYSRKTFARCGQDTLIPDVNWHRFRHTCATARLSAGWQLVRVSRMLGHSSVNTTAQHYAEFDLSASPAGFEGMLKVYGDFVRWLDEGYFS